MAFASYFDRNLRAAELLLPEFHAAAFKGALENETIGIAFDGHAAARAEGRTSLDLAVRLIARLYPNVALIALDEAAVPCRDELQNLALAINPDLTLASEAAGITKWLVAGETKPRLGPRSRRLIWHMGSDGWVAKLSDRRPVGSGRSPLPFGAGAAACLAVANLFRACFAAQLPRARPDKEVEFSILHLAPASTRKIARAPSVDLGETLLAGAGAIGNGFIWALARAPCTGTLHVIDHESLEHSNLQRYAMTAAGDEGKPKVELAARWLASSALSVYAHAMRWEDYVSSREDWRLERVAVAVDTAEVRIKIQASLARWTFNAWTQAGEVGVSRHPFIGDEACLACLYIPTGRQLNLDQIIARALRLPEDQAQLLDLRRRLDLSVPTERGFLERVAIAASIPLDALLAFEGKPLMEFYVRAICGGAVLEFAAGGGVERAEVPLAFQPALAGILLAADVYAHAAKLRKPLPTITQVNLLTALPEFPSRMHLKPHGLRCICGDEDFIAAYGAKYGNQA